MVAGMACEDGHGGDHNDQGDIYIMYVCLYVTKNEHFVSKKDVLPLSVCLSRSIITSHVNIAGAKRDVENTPKCTCPKCILVQQSSSGAAYDLV